jgi:hypothetical protein
MKYICFVNLLTANMRHQLDNIMLCGRFVLCWACPPADGGVDLVVKLRAKRSALGRVVECQGGLIVLAGISGPSQP